MEKLRRVATTLLSLLSVSFIIVVLAPLVVISGKIRKLIYRTDISTNIWKDKCSTIFRGATLFFYLELAVGLPTLAVWILDIDHLFDGIVAGGMLIAFFAFQYPRMFAPVISANFVDEKTQRKYYQITLKSSESVPLLEFSVTNLSMVHLRNYECYADFGNEFVLKVDKSMLVSLPDGGKRAIFKYESLSKGLPPFTAQHLYLPIIAPKRTGKYKIRFAVFSETTWGVGSADILAVVVDGEQA